MPPLAPQTLSAAVVPATPLDVDALNQGAQADASDKTAARPAVTPIKRSLFIASMLASSEEDM
jgi:hypothetical protein